jgi:hypothetical protein
VRSGGKRGPKVARELPLEVERVINGALLDVWVEPVDLVGG